MSTRHASGALKLRVFTEEEPTLKVLFLLHNLLKISRWNK